MKVRVIKKKEKYIPQRRDCVGKIWVEFSKEENIFEFDTQSEALDFITQQIKTYES